MRKLILILGILAFAALDPASATAQEVGQELTLQGCLVEGTGDTDAEYVLEGIGSDAIDADRLNLVPAEGVEIGAHVGHTVEVSGSVVAETDEGETDELALRVTQLSHIAASCSDGGDG